MGWNLVSNSPQDAPDHLNEQPRSHEILHAQYSRYDERNLCRETDVAFERDGQEISQRINTTPLIHSDMAN